MKRCVVIILSCSLFGVIHVAHAGSSCFHMYQGINCGTHYVVAGGGCATQAQIDAWDAHCIAQPNSLLVQCPGTKATDPATQPGACTCTTGYAYSTTAWACTKCAAGYVSIEGSCVPETSLIYDADHDTLVHVEAHPDEDVIRFDTGGIERMVLDAAGLTVHGPIWINDLFYYDSTEDDKTTPDIVLKDKAAAAAIYGERDRSTLIGYTHNWLEYKVKMPGSTILTPAFSVQTPGSVRIQNQADQSWVGLDIINDHPANIGSVLQLQGRPTAANAGMLKFVNSGAADTYDLYANAWGMKKDGDLKLAVYSQATEPSTIQVTNGFAAFWIDTDNNRLYLVYNQGGVVKGVELTD